MWPPPILKVHASHGTKNETTPVTGTQTLVPGLRVAALEELLCATMMWTSTWLQCSVQSWPASFLPLPVLSGVTARENLPPITAHQKDNSSNWRNVHSILGFDSRLTSNQLEAQSHSNEQHHSALACMVEPMWSQLWLSGFIAAGLQWVGGGTSMVHLFIVAFQSKQLQLEFHTVASLTDTYIPTANNGHFKLIHYCK